MDNNNNLIEDIIMNKNEPTAEEIETFKNCKENPKDGEALCPAICDYTTCDFKCDNMKLNSEYYDPSRRIYKEIEKNNLDLTTFTTSFARSEIDLARPKTNHKTAGFTNEERESFEKILKNCNIVDSYRYMNPDTIEYTFWTYMMKAREKNIGWRIDYFLVSDILKNKVNNVNFFI
jgi:exodeoxyribonuclease III